MQPAAGVLYGLLKPAQLTQQYGYTVSQLLLRQAARASPAIQTTPPTPQPTPSNPSCSSAYTHNTCTHTPPQTPAASTPIPSWLRTGSSNIRTLVWIKPGLSTLTHLPARPTAVPQPPRLSHPPPHIRTFTSGFWPSGQGRFPFALNFTNAVIGANLAAFLGQHLTNDRLTAKFMKSSWHIDQGEWWRLITPVFLHGDLWHLIINSYSLYNLGTSLEPTTGMPRFATIYFVSALAGNLFSYWYNHNNSVGASTALFGLLGAEAMMYWRNKHVLTNSSSNLQNIAVMIAINVAYGLSNPRIDNSGHFGGFVGGVIASYLLGPAYVRGRWGEYQDKPPIDIFSKK